MSYLYLSPLPEEKTPSFKVNRRLNVWYDHRTGKGGNLVDFGTLYFNCSVADLLQRLTSNQPIPGFSFRPPIQAGNRHPTAASFAGEKKEDTSGKIVVLDTHPLGSPVLILMEKSPTPATITKKWRHSGADWKSNMV